MAGKAGPYMNNDGLMFHYDTGNTVRSFKGQPTVNHIADLGDPTEERARGEFGQYFNLVPIFETYGLVPYTLSMEIKGNIPGYCLVYMQNSSYTKYAFVSSVVNISTEFQRFVFPNITPSGPTAGWQTNTPGDNRAMLATYTIYGTGRNPTIRNVQLERSAHVTPFTAGTRSVTQGLLDLTRNSTVNLANVSFDSNAQMTFDGTDDYAEMSSFNVDQNNEFTLEAIIYPNTISGNQSVIKKNTSNDNWPIFSMNLVGSNINGYYSSINYGQCLEGADGTSGIITANKFWHIAYSKGSGGFTTMKLYINGISVPYTNFLYGSHINNIASSNKPIHIGRNLDGATFIQPFNGLIPISRVFNRQLTDSEILQNFNAIKGRYGL